MERFQPADQPEADLVETIVSAKWRMNRLVGMETKIFEAEFLRHNKEAKKEFFVEAFPQPNEPTEPVPPPDERENTPSPGEQEAEAPAAEPAGGEEIR